MPGPGPRFRSNEVRDLRGNFIMPLGRCQELAFQRVASFVASYAERCIPVSEWPGVTGSALADANSACAAAGLTCDWPTLRQRSIEIGKGIPNVLYIGGDGHYRECTRLNPERVRAWAALYAADMIDLMAEQHTEAIANWGWW